jgi:Tfp pilus assembly protein PilX
MMQTRTSTKFCRSEGAALVVTLIVMVVLAVVAVAFMQNTSLDRSSARSVANVYRAKLAADSGLAEAMGLLQVAISNNRAFIVTETNHSADRSPVLLVGSNDATITTNLFPILSGSLDEYLSNRDSLDSLKTYLDKRLSTNPMDTVDLNMGSLRFIQATHSPDWYRAPWTYVTNVSSSGGSLVTNVFRYAFLVLDEQARLNPLLHRGFEATARTNFGRTAQEVRVDTDGARIVADENAIESILQASNQITTPQTLAFLSGTDFEAIKHLVSVHRAIDEDIIPSGYLVTTESGTNFMAYSDGGKPKYNLNDLATNTTHGASPEERAKKIAGIISANLPEFHRRDKGSVAADLSADLYLTRIAASIVDYIDDDDRPTAGLNGEPAGKDLQPYTVMVAERNSWVSETSSAPYVIDIRSEFFVQLWNPYTTEVNGVVQFEVGNRQFIELRGLGGGQFDFDGFSSAPVPVTLRPNEMRAFSLGGANQLFTNTVTRPSSSPATYPTWTNTSAGSSSLTGNPQFVMSWNASIADMSRCSTNGVTMAAPAMTGLRRLGPGNQFGPVGIQRITFNFAPQNAPNSVADPRANYICSTDFTALNNISLARWQGRQTDTAGRSQNLETTWRFRDFVAASAAEGVAMTSLSQDPTAIPSTWSPAVGQAAPVFIRNDRMLSIGELGNIFDPALVNNFGEATQGGAAESYFRHVGGRSLRIGQPESPFWDRGGQRAMQLLDLFTVNPLGTNVTELASSAYTNVPVMRGRINANTAPRAVLESVFTGITLTADEVLGAPEVDSSMLADTIISNRPYSRVSDFYKAVSSFADGANYSPAIPNVTVTIDNTNAGTVDNYTAMRAMDRAREEVFAKSVNLLGTQSRAFRVFVVGEALDRQTNALSRARLEAFVELKPLDGQSTFVQEVKMKKFQ